jgi:tetratricopeptide (TPR) repeat protein
MKTHLFLHFFRAAAVVTLLSFPAFAADTSPTTITPPVTVEELIKKGAEFDDRFDAKDALQYYDEAEKLDPKNADLLVRIARQYRYMLADASSKTEKLRLGHIALGYSERAAAAGPKNPEAQLAVAITLGKMLPYMNNKDQVEATPRIKESVDSALALDPRDDTAWDILGRWNRVLADISGLKRILAGAVYGKLPKGSNEAAEACLKKAIAIDPHRLMHYVELGRVYAQMGRKDEARRCIDKGLSMPNREKDDPETKERGRQALAKLK